MAITKVPVELSPTIIELVKLDPPSLNVGPPLVSSHATPEPVEVNTCPSEP